MLGFVSNCTIVLYPYEWVHDSLDILKRCSTYLCRLSKIKLREEQDTAIGHIDFLQEIITATIIESHLSIIVPDSDTYMFQRIPFQSNVEIDQLSFIVANVDVKIIETLPDKPLGGQSVAVAQADDREGNGEICFFIISSSFGRFYGHFKRSDECPEP